MAEDIKSISEIMINGTKHPIDAKAVGGKTVENIGELVTSIDGTSTDSQYPSAKCIYDMIYGASGSVNTNYIKMIGSGTLDYFLAIKEVGSGWDASDSSVLYVNNEIWTYNSVYDNVYPTSGGNQLSTEFAKREYGQTIETGSAQRIYVYKDLSGAYYTSLHTGGGSGR